MHIDFKALHSSKQCLLRDSKTIILKIYESYDIKILNLNISLNLENLLLLIGDPEVFLSSTTGCLVHILR